MKSNNNNIPIINNIRIKPNKKSINNNSNNNTERKICGCMATSHNFIGSCISCGRIVCEIEGPIEKYNECVFCHGTCFPPMSSNDIVYIPELNNESTIKAYQMKDKLLVFDKEHAKRTQVFDSQADYYESSTWLTNEEKKAIDEKQKKRLDKYKPSNRKINVAIDIDNKSLIKVVNHEEEEEDEVDNTVVCKISKDDFNDDMASNSLYDYNSNYISNFNDEVVNQSTSNNNTYSYSNNSSNSLTNENTKAGYIYRQLVEKIESKQSKV